MDISPYFFIKKQPKANGRFHNSESDFFNLNKLIKLLNATPNWQPLPPMECDRTIRRKVHLSSEEVLLEKFSVIYSKQRDFSSCSERNQFLSLVQAIAKNRFCFSDWVERSKPEHILRVATCLRLLMRDNNCRNYFLKLDGISEVFKVFTNITSRYFSGESNGHLENIILEILNIFQKIFSNLNRQCDLFSPEFKNVIKILIKLTYISSKLLIVHSSLYTLHIVVQMKNANNHVYDISLVEHVIRIIQDGHVMSKILAGNILAVISVDEEVKSFIQLLQAVPIILSGLKFSGLTWNLLWTLISLIRNSETLTELVYQTGGIPIFIDLLRNKHHLTVKGENAFTPASAMAKVRNDHVNDKEMDSENYSLNIKYAACVAITEASMNAACARQIVANNGLYHIVKLLLPTTTISSMSRGLQASALRALRFIYAIEKNHSLFKCFFPVEIYNKFVELNNYDHELQKYELLVKEINSFAPAKIEQMSGQLEQHNLTKKTAKFVRNYQLYSVLGTGSFGTVYSAKRLDGTKWLAIKEVRTMTHKGAKNELENLVRELNVIERELDNPNIVHYYKTFVEDHVLYIVMDYVDGISLNDFVLMAKSRNLIVQEHRIWKIVVQITLALRYLHEDKNIVHRDLTSKNIIFGDNDNITIIDFGLAKVNNSKNDSMSSLVGTRCFCCPEILLNKSYDNKVDIWSFGCVIYHVCQLRLPFEEHNVLELVTNIVEGKYPEIPTNKYSNKLKELISSCLIVEPEYRPDIKKISASIINRIIEYLETNNKSTIRTQKSLENIIKQTNRSMPEKIVSFEDRVFHSETTVSEISTDSGVGNCLRVNGISRSQRGLAPLSGYSTKSALSIPQQNIRSRNDPVIQMLELLNKIKIISTLNYDKEHEIRVLIVERFQRTMFSKKSTAIFQKEHLNLVLKRSSDPIDLNLSPEIIEELNREMKNAGIEILDVDTNILTYECLHQIIDSFDENVD